jgi:pteridine reductase
LINQGLLALLRNSTLSGGPAITHITDAVGDRPAPGFAHYAASKVALESLTRSTAREWAPHIRVNAVGPGMVLPPISMDADQVRTAVQTIPLHRVGTPEDVARTVVFLTQSAPYVTGQVWRIDGGLSTLGPMREL